MTRRTSILAGAAVVLVVALGAALFALRGGSAPLDTGAPRPMEFDPSAVRATPEPKVEVLNASGRSGLARDVTERLRAAGFDVVYYGNAERGTPDTTLVLARRGDDGAARRVASALGVDRVDSRAAPGRMVDVSVVLGKDWKAPAGRESEPPDTSGA